MASCNTTNATAAAEDNHDYRKQPERAERTNDRAARRLKFGILSKKIIRHDHFAR